MQNRRNKKPILPCTAPKGVCAGNTIMCTKTAILMTNKTTNITQSHLVCFFKLLNFCHQLLLPKCKYRCSTTNMNINIPRQQCRYINSENEKPHRPSPPHASICMLDASVNTAKNISQRLHTFNFGILFIVMYCFSVNLLFLPRFENRNDNDIGKPY